MLNRLKVLVIDWAAFVIWVTYHINTVDCAQLEGLIFGVENHIDHGTDFSREDVVVGDKVNTLLQPLLEGCLGALNTRFDHVASHQLEALLQVRSELLIGPMQIPNERLQRVQLPEKVLGRGASIPAGKHDDEKTFIV